MIQPTSALLHLAFTFALGASLQAQTVTIAPSDKGLRIEIDGALFTEYVTKDATRPFFYPVLGANGAGLTREHPPAPGVKVDHPHHSSIWFGHDGVNGVNFWFHGADAGRVENTGFTDIKAAGPKASFSSTSRWVKPNGDLVLNDERHFSVTAFPDGARQLDIALTLRATAGDVTFRDSKEGTMGMRIAPSLTLTGNKYNPKGGNGHILTSEGITDAKAWGTRAEWVAYYGPDPKGEPVSITMMDHPRNLRHPTWWHVRGYGLFAANPFGQSDFEAPPKSAIKAGTAIGGSGDKGKYVLANGQALTQRYRILIQKGQPVSPVLKASFADFSAAQ